VERSPSAACRRLAWGFAAAAALIALIAPSSAVAQRVSGTWSWRNPEPQGGIARGIVRAGSYEYAIGDDGTLLRGADGDAGWTVLESGLDEPVTDLEVLDETTIVIDTSSGCETRISNDAGASFEPLFNTSASCLPVAASSFVSSTTGYLLLRDGAVERTTDGGATFTAVSSIPGTPAAIGIEDETRFAADEGRGVAVHFTSESSGIAFVTPTTRSSSAYETSDGGVSWSSVTLPPNANVEWLDYVNASTAYATGPRTLLHSSDGGASWQALPLPPAAESPEGVICQQASECYAKLWLSENMLMLDGGAAPGKRGATGVPVCAVDDLLPADIALVPSYGAGREAATMLSGEGGEACATQAARPEVEYDALAQGPGSLVSVFGRGLALSSDEGQAWTVVPRPGSSWLTGASFADPREGLTLDHAGIVRETDNGGASWRTLTTGTDGAPRAVAMAGARTVLALGAGGIRRSRGGGRFVSVGGRAAADAHLESFDTLGSTVVAYGVHAVLRSIDAGETWSKIPLPHLAGRAAVDVRSVSFVNARRVYLLDSSSSLWFTDDSGRHWRQDLSAGAADATEVDFINATSGYLGGGIYPTGEEQDDAYVLHTSDGGATWSPQFVGPGWSFGGLAAGGSGAVTLLQEPTSGVSGTMLYATGSSGEHGADAARLTLGASQRRISPRELEADHGGVPVTVSGRLSTGAAGQRVVVGVRELRGGYWEAQVVTTGAEGEFSIHQRIGTSKVFVAQWLGGFTHSGAGSPALTITMQA
jgi:photosystem II stability/assembly factor-like uncharacterized protein